MATETQGAGTLLPENAAELAAYRTRCMDGAAEQASAANKTVIQWSAGMMALSFAFISHVDDADAQVPLAWAITTWCCLGGAVLATVSTFFLSARAAQSHAARAEEIERTPHLFTDDAFPSTIAGSTSGVLHTLSWWLFIVGTVSFVGMFTVGTVALQNT